VILDKFGRIPDFQFPVAGFFFKEDIMTAIKAFIKRHPVATYFALTFALSWGGMLIVVGPGGISANGEQSEMLVLFAYLAMLAGPSVAGMLLTALVDGRAGLRELGSRLLRWRLGARWYALALLTAPLVITTVLLALSLRSPAFLPRIFSTEDKVFLLRFSVVAGLMVGIFEELGWTGFAVPKMRLRYGVLGTGLIVGLVFAAWDFLVVFWVSAATSTAGALPMAIFMPAVLFTWLPPYRVLMVWVYDQTGSLLVVMLMHTSLVVFWTSLTPLALVGMTLVTYYLVVTAALWVVVAAVAVANHGHLSRQPLRTRMA
jgi:CAAX protease family protein